MKANVYIQLEESPSSGYISVKDAIFENNIKGAYEEDIESAKKYGFRKKIEVFEGFKLKYILLEVNFDGRSGIKEEDVKLSLVKQSLAFKSGESMFGSHCLPTEQLKEILNKQLEQRKELINNGKYKVIA